MDNEELLLEEEFNNIINGNIELCQNIEAMDIEISQLRAQLYFQKEVENTLKKVEKDNYEFKKDISILALLNKLIEINSKLLQACVVILHNLHNDKNQGQISQTTGVVVSVAGSALALASIIAIPFTAGLSIPIGLGLGGSAAGLVGGLTFSGTDLVQKFLTKNYQKKLDKLIDQQQKAALDLENKFSNFKQLVIGIQEFQGIDEDEAYQIVQYAVQSNRISLDNLQEDLEFLKQNLNDLKYNLKCNTARLSSSTYIPMKGQNISQLLTSNTLRIAAMAASVVAGVADDAAIAALKGLGIAGGRGLAMGVVQGVAAGVGTYFTIVDIKHLVENWDKKDPLSEVILELIPAYMQDIERCKQLKVFFTYA